MKNFIFILLFSFISLFAQVQNQQQRADNGKPYTVAIHRLNNKTLNDSLLMEVEDTTNYFSRRTSVGQLKNYIAGNTIASDNFHIQLNATVEIIGSDTTITSVSNPGYTKMYYDLDGDSILYDKTWIDGASTIKLELKKPNGAVSNLPTWEDNRVSGNVQDPSSSNKTTCYAAVYSSGSIYIYWFVCSTGIYIQPMNTIASNTNFVNFELQVK